MSRQPGGFAAADLFDFASADPAPVAHKRRIERGLLLQEQFSAVFPEAIPVVHLETGEVVLSASQQSPLDIEVQGHADAYSALTILSLDVLGLRLFALQRDVLVVGEFAASCS